MNFILKFLSFLAVSGQASAANDYFMKKFECSSFNESVVRIKCGVAEKSLALNLTFSKPMTTLKVKIFQLFVPKSIK
jgi:hypothetical protein